MPQRLIVGVTAEAVGFVLYLSSDHRTLASGVTPSLVKLSKGGGAFANPAGAVVEAAPGRYEFRPGAADVSASRPCILHVEAPGCDPADIPFDVAPDESAPALLQYGSGWPLLFLVVQSDGITGATGLSPVATISKQAGAFLPAVGPVAELDYGNYKLDPTAADLDTAGALILAATAPGAFADPVLWDVAPAPAPPVAPIPVPLSWILILSAGAAGTAATTAPYTPRRDGPVYLQIAALLESTGEFEQVTTSRTPAQVGIPGDAESWAHIQQLGADAAGDGSPYRQFRNPSYRLTAEVRIPEDVDAYDEADRIEASIRNALLSPANRSYAGYCLPEYSALGTARYDYSALPTVRLQIDGRFGYAVDMARGGYQSAS